jgi:pimeloyl-ACP methyl ester carboxylesterase
MTSLGPAATKEAPWRFAAQWGARGYITDFDGPVHWIEFGDFPQGGFPQGGSHQDAPRQDARRQDTGKPPIVFVHGLGGSHLNWGLIGSQLAAGRRAVALDLHGFGLTPGTRQTASVQANRKLLDRFVREITGTPVILVGNSMGGLISILQSAAAPETVQGLVLIDPALPLPRRSPDWRVAGQFLLYTLPGFGEFYLSRLLRQPPQVSVQQVIELCFADPSRADPAMVTASIALAAHRLGERQASRRLAKASDDSFLAASRSLMRVVGQRRRYWEMMASVRIPVLLIGGDADRLVPVVGVRQAGARNPRWDTAVLAGVGHTPQLEVPGQTVEKINGWLARNLPGG